MVSKGKLADTKLDTLSLPSEVQISKLWRHCLRRRSNAAGIIIATSQVLVPLHQPSLKDAPNDGGSIGCLCWMVLHQPDAFDVGTFD